jgi:hypothetical protein
MFYKSGENPNTVATRYTMRLILNPESYQGMMGMSVGTFKKCDEKRMITLLAEPPLLGGGSPHVHPIVRLFVCRQGTVALAFVNPSYGNQTLVITCHFGRSTFRGITPTIVGRQFFSSLAMRLVLVALAPSRTPRGSGAHAPSSTRVCLSACLQLFEQFRTPPQPNILLIVGVRMT